MFGVRTFAVGLLMASPAGFSSRTSTSFGPVMALMSFRA